MTQFHPEQSHRTLFPRLCSSVARRCTRPLSTRTFFFLTVTLPGYWPPAHRKKNQTNQKSHSPFCQWIFTSSHRNRPQTVESRSVRTLCFLHFIVADVNPKFPVGRVPSPPTESDRKKGQRNVHRSWL